MFSHQKFTELNDLSCQDIGGKILFATDDWFAGNYFDNWQNGFYPHSTSSKLFVFVILLLFFFWSNTGFSLKSHDKHKWQHYTNICLIAYKIRFLQIFDIFIKIFAKVGRKVGLVQYM